jgi:hypothetical protein
MTPNLDIALLKSSIFYVDYFFETEKALKYHDGNLRGNLKNKPLEKSGFCK